MSIITNYSDEDLAEFMKMAISESSESDYAEAYTMFFQRLKGLVRHRCLKFTSVMGLPSSTADDMFSDFFSKFSWSSESKILSFDPSKSQSRYPLQAWAMKVLQNIARDMASRHLARRSHETLLSQEDWDDLPPFVEGEPHSEPPSTPERQAIAKALAAQTDRNREIILEYALQMPLSTSQRSAKGIYDKIGAMYDTSGDNVKKIYSRFRQMALQLQASQ